jgi:hypothetical protein
MPDTNEFSLETVTLFRGAVEAKIECWKNITATEKSIGDNVTIEEADIEDLVTGINSSAELTNEGIQRWLNKFVYRDED